MKHKINSLCSSRQDSSSSSVGLAIKRRVGSAHICERMVGKMFSLDTVLCAHIVLHLNALFIERGLTIRLNGIVGENDCI